jgi:hypothetical protein
MTLILAILTLLGTLRWRRQTVAAAARRVIGEEMAQ